ncbi:protealysin inhibitor emfourin [Micromonospora sp. NPDC049301]|uniref:protealysin inhibitor emfourin n=1 Tax=Micromonospora sp. NPDC049301 TaxID=3155723 RepID=UPI0034129048
MRPASTTGVTVALLVALLAGCTSDDRAGTAPDQPPATIGPTPTGPATGVPPTTVPTTPGTPAPTGPDATGSTATRVMLFRSGGFAGRGDAVTVEPDGRWTLVDRAGSRRTGRLDTTDLGRLRGLAADPRLAAEARRPTTPTSCADAFSYRLTVGTVETAYVDCPADAAPPPATRALVELLLRATG